MVVKTVSSTDRNGPAGTPGMHRYAWDMRYPDAHGIAGGTFLAGALITAVALAALPLIRRRVG